MSQRKTVRVEHQIDIDYENVSDVIKHLEGIREEYGEVFISVEVEEDYGSFYPKVYFVTTREETDAEMEKRLASEERIKEFRRNQYLELKKEFEE